MLIFWIYPDDNTAEFISRFFIKLKEGMSQVKALTKAGISEK
jgi:CHAT domain-containing protein